MCLPEFSHGLCGESGGRGGCLLVVRRCVLWLMAALGLVTAGIAAPVRPPNIIVILADDLGCGDISLYRGWVKTPRIDRMAREGLTFTDFHANSSVCSPSRAAFLTGRYHPRGGVRDVSTGGERLNLDETTIAETFKAAGYTTG